MENAVIKANCNCRTAGKSERTGILYSGTKKAVKVLPSFFTSLLIAFFPKCPLCWAVYMSMFGALGLTKLPYMPWLLPVLLLCLGLHLFLIFRKASKKGYLPFSISAAGVMLLLAGRLFMPSAQWLLLAAMTMVITGSFLNSFLSARLSLRTAMPILS